MKRVMNLVVVSSFVMLGATAYAKTVRFPEVGGAELGRLLEGEGSEEVVVEFRAGDVLPIQLRAEGGVVTTATPGQLKVQQTFFLRKNGDDLELSWDGERFASLTEQIAGSLSASAGEHGVEIYLRADRDGQRASRSAPVK